MLIGARPDILKVTSLLEEHAILSEKYFLEAFEITDKLSRIEYAKNINGHVIHTVFEKFTDKNNMFLMNAWVKTK